MAASSFDACRFIFYQSLVDDMPSNAAKPRDLTMDKAFTILEYDENLDSTLSAIEAEVQRVRGTPQYHHLVSLELDVASARILGEGLTSMSKQQVKQQNHLKRSRQKIQELETLQEQDRAHQQEQMKIAQDWERTNRKRQRSCEQEVQRARDEIDEIKTELNDVKAQKESLAQRLQQTERRLHSQPRITECGMCWQSGQAMTLLCGHVFCRPCLDRWRSERGGRDECAICRKQSLSRVSLYV